MRERVGKLTMLLLALSLLGGCTTSNEAEPVEAGGPTAAELLGNPAYRAISYSGWRSERRADELAPTIDEIKEDLRIIHAMGLRFIRTYNTQQFPQTERILEAIAELKVADPGFEMYVMLGAWIQCQGIHTSEADHSLGDVETNTREIARAIELTRMYPDIVKVIAVGNEAMVTWQPHHVAPAIILKWINVLRAARASGQLPADLWITTSDNWAALGGEETYRNDDLVEVLRAIDYVSLHTYAFHDTFYYPTLDWAVDEDASLPVAEQQARAVKRAIDHQKSQVEAVRAYMTANGIEREIHIGETGWASRDDSHYGDAGTGAANELSQKLFHDGIRAWMLEEGMSCFYFQAFDEPWKSSTPDGSESHFGLFTVDGKAKYVVWDFVDAGVFESLGRSGNPGTKTFDGDIDRLMETVKPPVILKFDPDGDN